MAEAERTKELNFLKEFYDGNYHYTSNEDLVKTFNELF